MVACTTRTPTGGGGLPQPTVIVTRTTWAWVVAISSPRITAVRPTGSLSAASPTPPNARRYPLSYILSGYYNWGTGYMGGQDSSGYWWSTTAGSDSSAYSLSMHSSDLNPQYNYNKADGFTLRCVSLGFTFSRRYPLSYVFSGDYSWESGGALSGQGQWSNWWSLLAATSSNAYSLSSSSSVLSPQNNYTKAYGFALRCVGGEKIHRL